MLSKLSKPSGNGTWRPQDLYVMINFPFVWKFKIGVSKDAWGRAWDLTFDDDYPGAFFPVAINRMWFAYSLEQVLLNNTLFAKTQIMGKGGIEIRKWYIGIASCLLVWLLFFLKAAAYVFSFYKFAEYASYQ